MASYYRGKMQAIRDCIALTTKVAGECKRITDSTLQAVSQVNDKADKAVAALKQCQSPTINRVRDLLKDR